MEYNNFKYQSINMYDELKRVYGDYLRDEITSVSLIQSQDKVWLEIIEEIGVENGLVKKIIDRDDLSFIAESDDEDDLFFKPQMPVEHNVMKFIKDFDIVSIVNTTNLFKNEVWDIINKEKNSTK